MGRNIEFEMKTSDKEVFVHSIRIEGFTGRTKKRLIDPDEVVVKTDSVVIVFDYPLEKEIEVTKQKIGGFTRADLVEIIHDEYVRIYKEEDESIKGLENDTEDDDSVLLLNRNKPAGKHGIWGHDMGDLFLEGASVSELDPNISKVELSIGS